MIERLHAAGDAWLRSAKTIVSGDGSVPCMMYVATPSGVRAVGIDRPPSTPADRIALVREILTSLSGFAYALCSASWITEGGARRGEALSVCVCVRGEPLSELRVVRVMRDPLAFDGPHETTVVLTVDPWGESSKETWH